MKITPPMSILVCLVATTACSDTQPAERDLPPASSSHEGGERTASPADRPAQEVPERRRAEAKFETIDGLQLEGSADLQEDPTGVQLTASVAHAPPGEHGFHVHERADCSDIAGKSMGGHFAPEGHRHGLPTAPERHLGDLGNLSVDDDGKGMLSETVAGANLIQGDPKSFVGRALVIHEGPDDGGGTSGNAGRPIACAVIEAY